MHKHKKRNEEDLKKLMNRLNRIEGQIHGVKKMIENDVYCPDILIQVSAIQAALSSFSKVILSDHIKTCILDDVKDGNEESLEELVEVLQKVMK